MEALCVASFFFCDVCFFFRVTRVGVSGLQRDHAVAQRAIVYSSGLRTCFTFILGRRVLLASSLFRYVNFFSGNARWRSLICIFFFSGDTRWLIVIRSASSQLRSTRTFIHRGLRTCFALFLGRRVLLASSLFRCVSFFGQRALACRDLLRDRTVAQRANVYSSLASSFLRDVNFFFRVTRVGAS